MKKKFEVLKHIDLSQIQMWLNQKQTTKGGVVIESPLQYVKELNMFVLIISYTENV
jgi:hypothetical protein